MAYLGRFHVCWLEAKGMLGGTQQRSTKETRMAGSLESERKAIEAEETRLAERRKRLQEREQFERQKLIGKSVLMKASEDQLDTVLKRMKALGLDETIKRLA